MTGGWNIYKHGGRMDIGIDAVEWAKKAEALGAGEILLTSMDCDGTKAGIRYRADKNDRRMYPSRSSHPVVQVPWSISTNALKKAEQMQLWQHPCSTIKSWKFVK